jgi:putative tryptophan/tyrosine transport system substrate-binding protein
LNGRYRRHSGHCSALARNGSVANDPTATSAVHCGNNFDARFGLYQTTRVSRYNAAPELGVDMRRRKFISLLGGAAAGWPLSALAQEAGRKYRIAFLSPIPRNRPNIVALFDELQQFGFVEGQNLTIDHRAYGQHIELLSKYAEELFATPADVIIAAGDPAIRVAQQATKTTPILASADDMVGSGFVSSLAKPGGNTTGVSFQSTELDGKRQDILIEAVPGLGRMAALADTNTTAPRRLEALQGAARAHGVTLSIHRVTSADQIAPAIDAAKKSEAGALNVLASPLFSSNRQVVIDRAAALQLPAIYQWPEMAEEGGFLGYGPRLVQIYRGILARQLIKLLRGAKPGDLPVEQPTKFEFVINMKTAKALGLAVSKSMQLLADDVIE